MPEPTKTCPHCGAPEDQEFPFMFLCGSSTKVVSRTWACQHIQAMNRGIAAGFGEGE
jgi:transposase